ncbi:MFS transporter [Allopusillimonas ginsengisoli]|uniref:MFS transporter n=1 Tax=Allopusillimonas ginsengisoli TaxID=453575 RepID=UPI001021361F|nr:MFS transporter [Allopusillimonas ginsengisoli]TEA77514.1 MFS transporter [Allopusillimonas ginsengisoli]
MTAQQTYYRATSPLLLIAGILLIASTLRAPITGVAPVLSMIQDSFGLSTAQAGLLTTLPLLAFAAISPFSALFARKYGLERSLFCALILMAGGIALRSAGPVWCLYLGTWIIGSGIAVGNVLLPSLLKRDFPQRIAGLTGAYVVTMGVAAALASASAVPLAGIPGAGWPVALGAMMLLPLAALLCWIPQRSRHTPPASTTSTPPRGGRIWHASLAWQVTLYMGLNSFLYYVLAGWLPAILADAGFSPSEAGSLHGFMQLASAIPGLALASLVSRMQDQKAIALWSSLLTATGLLGLLMYPAGAVIWVLCFGAGTGAGVTLSLIFMSLRVSSASQAAALSGMAQCVGYTLAACGPPLIGMLHDRTGGWMLPLAGCVLLSLVMTLFGLLAGRARTIQ